MESSSKMLSNIYPGLENVNLGIFSKSGFWQLFHHCMVIVIEKSTLLSGAREAGHIHCDLVGNTIFYVDNIVSMVGAQV